MLSRSVIARGLMFAAVIATTALTPTTSTASLATSPANAAVTVAQASCTEQTEFYTFTPPLKTLPTAGTTTFKGTKIDRGTCVTPVGEYVELQSATGSGQNLSCTLNTAVTGTLKLKWTNSAGVSTGTSTITLGNLSISATKVITFTGSVTAGRFTGTNNFTLVYASIANTTLCLTTQGLVSAAGPGVLTIN